MLHCGGNGIGTMSLRHLQKFIKLTVSNILAVRPNCKIIWSQSLPRTYYRHNFSHVAAENARAIINNSLSNFIIARNGGYINYPDLQRRSHTLYCDSTHHTDCAQTVFLNAIRGGLFKIFRENLKTFSPLSS